ncbi:hypothetical protein QT711_11355 [Sporosarcina saromensis]|uniref:Phage protein n=1 Tax=Sporosarcina saromensis TaxID=359365 RepID=A0ABU4GBV5_9BACL|nr:hypothetical protein [Sporosarcina saromensis]MDW0113785.1 hypothetical protein [Sporosarcina saromensis]
MKIKRKIHQSEMTDINNQIRMIKWNLDTLINLLKEKNLNELEINNALAVAGLTLNNLAQKTMTAVRSVGKEID